MAAVYDARQGDIAGLALGAVASFPTVAPMVFASSAFVPLDSMPGWLRVFADHQPVTDTVVAWSIGMVLVFAPLAVAKYRRTA